MRIKIMAESADHSQKMTPEWVYLINVDDIEEKEQSFSISPNEETRKNLERRLGIEKLNNVKAELKVRRENSRVIKVTGKFKAEILQNCVVTLQPLKNRIEDTFEAWFADPQKAISFARARHERDKDKGDIERPMLEEHEDPEPIIDGKINLGELVTQYISLSIDPYPHSEEAQKVLEAQNDSAPVRENPFAALKALKEEK